MRALWVSALLWVPCIVLFLLLYATATIAAFLFGFIIAPGVLALGVWRLTLRRARAMRPSDVELSAEALHVRGGPADGLTLRYVELERVFVRRATGWVPRFWSLTPLARDEDDDARDLHVLFVELSSGALVRLAATRAPTELASLEQLAGTLEAAIATAPAAPQPLPPDVLRCPSCRGPVAPSSKAVLTCPWCQAQLETSPSLREKVQAAELVASHSLDGVRAVLEQPRAESLAHRFRWLTVALMSGWVLGLVGVFVASLRGRELSESVALVSLFVLGTVTGGFSLFRALLVDRQALRVLTMHFAARPPVKPGTPHACRSCRGPLPESAGPVAQCVWCGAPNLLGADVRVDASRVLEERRSLEAVLEGRRARRLRWRAVAGLGAVATAAGAVAFILLLVRP